MRKILMGFVCLFFVAQLTGCHTLKGFFKESKKSKKSRLKKQVKQLAANKDLDGLAKMCTDKVYSACTEASRLRAERFLTDQRCEEVEERFATALKGAKRSMYERIYYEGGLKLAKCKKWDYIFRKLLAHRNRGRKLLTQLEEKGLSSQSQLLRWMKAQQEGPFAFKSSSHRYVALEASIKFLQARNTLKAQCRDFLKYYHKVKFENLKGLFIQAFSLASCKNALPVVLKRLTHPKTWARRQACFVMRNIGNSSHLRRLRIVAYTDSSYKVRIDCRSSAGQIQLKSK